MITWFLLFKYVWINPDIFYDKDIRRPNINSPDQPRLSRTDTNSYNYQFKFKLHIKRKHSFEKYE